jgi:Fur family ferric uptake transcriptional regulator
VRNPARWTKSSPWSERKGVGPRLRAGHSSKSSSRPIAHLTAEELATIVQGRSPDVHLSTIYRNLEELERLGVVVHTHLGHGPLTYQLATHAHAHFICKECGKRIEAGDDLFQDLERRARRDLGFAIDPHHVAIFGRCADCAAT